MILAKSFKTQNTLLYPSFLVNFLAFELSNFLSIT